MKRKPHRSSRNGEHRRDTDRHSSSVTRYKPAHNQPEHKERLERKERPERDERKARPTKARPTKERPNAARPANPQTKNTHSHRDQRTPDARPTRDRDTSLLWGFHAVRAAWLNPKRRCFRLWLTEAGDASFAETMATSREELLKRPDPKRIDRQEMDRLLPPGSVHQGIVLEAGPLPEPSLHDLITTDNPPDVLVMLDQVTDPHNIGAILRSAAALGAGAVILTERNAPGMTGVQAKTASGAAEYVPQIHVVNLSRALDELRQAGYWCVGLAEEGEKNLDACDLSGRTVLVLGAEGEGLRQLTRKKCDELARLPTGGPVGSLNVSNAAAVALYEAKRQKKSI